MSTVFPPLFWAWQNRDMLQLTGRDRQSFLQGMVSNDVAKLAPGEGCYAFMLTATGQVLADMRVLCLADRLLLDLEPGLAPFVAETLDKYLIMEKCRITDVSSDWGTMVVGGAEAAKFLRDDFGVENAGEWIGEGVNAHVSPHSDSVIVARSFHASVPLFNVHFTNPGNMDVVYIPRDEKGVDYGEVPAETLDALRIEAGIPRFGVDINSKVLALETGQQERAVSFRKGCYIGQEIVARIDARGRTNRSLVGFWLSENSVVPAETPVFVEDREVGRITSTAVSPSLGTPIGLGYVRNEFVPGTAVTVGDTNAIVAALPFVDTPKT